MSAVNGRHPITPPDEIVQIPNAGMATMPLPGAPGSMILIFIVGNRHYQFVLNSDGRKEAIRLLSQIDVFGPGDMPAERSPHG